MVSLIYQGRPKERRLTGYRIGCPRRVVPRRGVVGDIQAIATVSRATHFTLISNVQPFIKESHAWCIVRRGTGYQQLLPIWIGIIGIAVEKIYAVASLALIHKKGHLEKSQDRLIATEFELY